ncbi:MAG: DUF2344 domain-containing protein [Clostridiales bacterium]|nr:DUF2344 domain-containing protein [Clostridiales bacterium]
MGKYLLKFKKLGLIRYTSHLDLVRLFHRAFKRQGISLTYSKGFNPHPKMSFGQPLSLGFESVGEYLEFETSESYEAKDIKDMLNIAMPDGIEITDCWKIDTNQKSISSSVEWASYEIQWDCEFDSSLIEEFLNQDKIIALKRQKKKSTMKEIDIKPLIYKFNKLDGNKGLYAMVRTGSSSNLNPQLLLEAFYQFLNREYSKDNCIIVRLDLYNSRLEPLSSQLLT